MEVTARKPYSLPPPQQPLSPAPSTPKKKPKYISGETPSARQKIKSFTQIKQKESVSLIYLILVFLWLLVFGCTLFLALQAKATNEIEQCRLDFEHNRCLNPVKGLISYCNLKNDCLNEDLAVRVARTINYSALLAEVLYQFVQGSGAIVIVVGLGLVGMCLKHRGKYKQTVVLQFYEDK